jgi:drug/metabolite transporter (DMT)-like permease
MIVAPEASLPERAMVLFIPLALIAPLFYGLEGNIVAKWGTAGLSPVEVLYGASLLGAILAFPVALITGSFISPLPPWGLPDAAILLAAAIHVVVYTTYVWLVGVAGPIFAVQVSYLVTVFGVFWAIIILDESYSGWVWGAMVVIMAGVFLVQPRQSQALADEDEESTIKGDGL